MRIEAPDVPNARRRMAQAESALAAARTRLDDAKTHLNDVIAEKIIAGLRRIDWEVVYELSIGSTLVRYMPYEDNPNLPGRFAEKPGCLISGEFDRRTPVSERTMDVLTRSGLAEWSVRPGQPNEMKLTDTGRRRAPGIRPSAR